MLDDEDDKPPSEGAPGAFLEASKAGLSLLGPPGAIAAFVLDRLAGPVVRRRHDDWCADLHERVRKLEANKALTEDDLKGELFADAVIAASRAAAATSSQEKRDALRNAVLNVALKHAPAEADIQQLLLRYVDELTPTHVQLLKVVSEPGSIENTFGGSVEKMPIEEFFPGGPKAAKAAGAERFLEDLISRGLVSFEQRRQAQPALAVLRHPKWDFKATPFGRQFLDFISEPPELGE
jgi:hypothetical protein